MTRPINIVSAHAALADDLRRRVLANEFPPGTSLSEEEIAAYYGVARPTVRAALQSLVQGGVLRREAYRSAYVPEMTKDDVRDLFFVRTSLEVQVANTLAARGFRPPEAHAAVLRMEALPEDAPWRDVVDADAQFHLALVRAVDSSRMLRVYETLGNEIRLALVQLEPAYDSISALCDEHHRILDAITTGPKELAVELMTQHLDQAVRDLTGD